MAGRGKRNQSKMGETCIEGNESRNKGKEKVNEDENHVSSSNNAQMMKQKNKQVAEEPEMFDRSHPPYFRYEDSDSDYGFDFDYEYGFGYEYDSDFHYDYDSDFDYGFDFCDDMGFPNPWSGLPDIFLPYSLHGDVEEFEEDSDDYTYKMAIPQKEEDELIERQMNIGVMSMLPSDVVFDIISRLPIKTLARCRCVCKDFCRLTHIRRFIKMHHDRATRGDIPPSLVLHSRCCVNLRSDIFLLQHDTREDTLDGRAVIAHSRFLTEKKEFEVVGSCNGLLCLSEAMYYGPRLVCNPVTGEYIRLPKPNVRTDFDIVSGFGYDEATNDYKVVRMLFHSIDFGYGNAASSFKLEGEIYSLSLGKWRNIGDVPYALRGRASTAFVNGALHWMTGDYGSLNVSDLIISFDLGREEFQVVPPPRGFAPGPRSHMLTLGVLGERLCLFDYSSDKHLDIWVMKKYGVKESWTKEYVICRRDLCRDSGRVMPLRLMKNGELLMSCRGESLVFYDPARRRFKDIRIRGLPPRFEAITHVGSLFPLRNAVGLAKRDRCNFSFGEWCSNLFPIPAHESIMYGDKQPTEHGLKPSRGNGENLQCIKKPEERDGYQREEVVSGANKRVDDFDAFLKLFDKGMNSYMESRGILAMGESWERGRGGGYGRASGSGNGNERGRGRGRGRGWGRGRGGRSGRGGETGSRSGNGNEGGRGRGRGRGRGGGSRSVTGTANGNGRGRGRGTFVWRVKESKT